ncbi:MAG: antibiotic ABC transporter ATP-binding protein [Sphingobacteriaceae bacterium]|nr:antibiotic ABC transporter ATP-binding protein [Sphingobacteriaceae bacterium]
MEKAKSYTTWAVTLRILGLVRPYRKIFVATVLLVIALAILAPLRPWLIQYTVDGPIAAFDREGLLKMTALMAAVLILESVFRYAFSYWSTWLGQQAIHDLRNGLFHKLLQKRLRFFDKTPIGTLTTRTVSDIETIAEVFSQGLLTIVGDLLQLIAILAVMLYTDWRLTLISLSVLPLLVYSTYIFKEKVRLSFQEVRNEVARLNAFVQEHITGMRVVQLFNRESEEKRRFVEVNTSLNQAHLKSVMYYSVFFPVVEIITAASLGLLVWYGAGAALKDEISVGVIIAFILYVNQFFRPIRLLADKFNSLQMGVVASERVFKLLDLEEEVADTGTQVLENARGQVEFNEVWFAYDGEQMVLKGISFTAEPGKKIALVGPTGAGKSSVINVLGRYYEYQKGEVLLDGIAIRELPLASIQRHIGVVLQDVFLFSGTIADNISMFNSAISKEYMLEMAVVSGIDRFINKLPQGLDTPVGERGGLLSTGQRQLVAFLRVMVYNPTVVVLDEATASIDSETEEILQIAMKKVLENRTSIIIAHRLSTVTDADEILVIEDGCIAERGTHQQLMSQNGHYQALYELQLAQEKPE